MTPQEAVLAPPPPTPSPVSPAASEGAWLDVSLAAIRAHAAQLQSDLETVRREMAELAELQASVDHLFGQVEQLDWLEETSQLQ